MMFLTPHEIEQLTGKRQKCAQKKVLNEMGVIFKPRADGSLAVLKAHIDKTFGGFDEGDVRIKSEEPNLDGLNA